MMNNTPKKWVVVTGGSRGIGRAIVETLSADGMQVLFTYRNSCGQAKDVEREAGSFVIGEQVDGRDRDAVKDFAQRAIERLGPPHAVINNAGITRDGALMASRDDAWSDVVDNNLNAMVYMTKAFLPAMIEAGAGSVVQISSVTAIKGNAGQTNYAATKAGMLGFTRSLAHEVARFGVRVNAILPGLIETDMTSGMPEATRKSLKAMVPMRRMGRVSEIASCVCFLIGDGASYVTGQSLIVDGGLTA